MPPPRPAFFRRTPARRALHGVGSVLALLACALGCRVELGAPGASGQPAQNGGGPVLVYTSMYRPVVEALTAALAADLPAVQVQWYQAGSEKVAARLDTERAAGACPADLLATSDPAHFQRLKAQGALQPVLPVGALHVPRRLVDADGAFVALRVSTMVLAWHQQEPAPPARTADLWSDTLTGQAAVGDPLTSGTFFTSLAILERVHGPDLFDRMRAHQVVAAGSNAAVLEKLLGREKRAGMLLLENVLMARAAGQPVAWRVPEDGVVMVPGPVGVLRDAPHPVAARQVLEWLFSPRAQRILVDVGMMHAAREDLPPPPGVPPLQDLAPHALQLEAGTWEALERDGGAIKERFSRAYGR